jgi:hypothetical protein
MKKKSVACVQIPGPPRGGGAFGTKEEKGIFALSPLYAESIAVGPVLKAQRIQPLFVPGMGKPLSEPEAQRSFLCWSCKCYLVVRDPRVSKRVPAARFLAAVNLLSRGGDDELA